MRVNLLVTAIEVGGSIPLFHLAQQMGAMDVFSYLIGSVAPVVGGFLVWAKARKFSGASVRHVGCTAARTTLAWWRSDRPAPIFAAEPPLATHSFGVVPGDDRVLKAFVRR